MRQRRAGVMFDFDAHMNRGASIQLGGLYTSNARTRDIGFSNALSPRNGAVRRAFDELV